MRAPVPSFKDELKHYSDRLEAATKLAIKEGQIAASEAQRALAERMTDVSDQQYGRSLSRALTAAKASSKRRTMDQQHLHTWMKDFRAQEVWTALKNSRPDINAQEFIRNILRTRRVAVATVNRMALHKFHREQWKKKYRRGTSELLASNSKFSWQEIATELRAIADECDDLHLIGELSRQGESRLQVSKKDQKGSRAPMLFAQQVSKLLLRLCGRWHDQEVLILAEIAFPKFRWSKNNAEEQIRNWRRSIIVADRSWPVLH
jgi:hypothetical protein